MVALDEVQKLSEQEVSSVSNAFQMASRKGCDAILVVAGLPYAHEEAISYQGCTFMRRAAHVKLSLLERQEVIDAFLTGMPEEVILADNALSALVNASYGHPYMVQLLGFYLIEHLNAPGATKAYNVTSDDVTLAIGRALDAFKSRAFKPMVAGLSNSERNYLTTMAQVLDSERVAHVFDIAQALGKNMKKTS